ncbi:zinc finger HIT domain-containing protein 2 [Cydia splendana]|uniref:zinc finger HIT domain-containing protein 2 n=1 Tax=Cydia splendana TaxID=1100963 RepID=UPI00212EA906
MSDESSNTQSGKICGVCNENPSKYCCPRCEVLYCSLDCYRSEKHQECSENFYRNCVTEELASNHVDDESKRKMIDILKRMHEHDIDTEDIEEMLENMDSDDEEVEDLHERIKGLHLNDADQLWGALTEDERNEFEALLNKGDVGTIMPQWEPWWMFRKKEKKVEEITKEENEALKKCPELKTVPALDSLSTVQPSPAIKFNITNVIASYVFVMRYFNGDVEPLEWATHFLNVCANLDSNANFDDPAIAVETVVQKCLQSELIETDGPSLDVMKHDTYLILQGPSIDHKLYYCKSALSDLYRVLHKAKSISKAQPANEKKQSKDKTFSRKFPEHGTEHLPPLDGNKLKKCMKKVEYYLSFLESHSMDFE